MAKIIDTWNAEFILRCDTILGSILLENDWNVKFLCKDNRTAQNIESYCLLNGIEYSVEVSKTKLIVIEVLGKLE